MRLHVFQILYDKGCHSIYTIGFLFTRPGLMFSLFKIQMVLSLFLQTNGLLSYPWVQRRPKKPQIKNSGRQCKDQVIVGLQACCLSAWPQPVMTPATTFRNHDPRWGTGVSVIAQVAWSSNKTVVISRHINARLQSWCSLVCKLMLPLDGRSIEAFQILISKQMYGTYMIW